MTENNTKAFVYMLCCCDNSLYTGWTNDLEKRLKAHNNGTASRCTRSKRPLAIVFYEQRESKSDALKQEALIKKMSREQKLALVNSASHEVKAECERLNGMMKERIQKN